ncbi:glycosyltransferase family 1 protein [Aquirufa ecclesiirivi]|uniref:Glycosyltransferase family 1 protein n=1 Tax=Aquirufa ecclesiirivi TaxID=2715124 RepID=A0ABT4JGB1_9BACT|nr:glycosyltransferase [Aquirufa ecclesiirivi]MCZ2473532.1 glycosyltransferase family 1 protein [Aquirufa ecclesiirivi]MCZ2475315.1 glycosyltransferase family 1 protein [Aquirufa ecclesiirivi]
MGKIKIICIVENSISHLNPIFNLLIQLKKRGNNIDSYFLSHATFQDIIEEKGFDFIESHSVSFGLENHEIYCQNYVDKLLYCLNENNFEKRKNDLFHHICKIMPQYVFVDSMLWGDQIILESIRCEKFDFKIKNIKTIFDTHFSTYNLPIHSRYVPQNFELGVRIIIYLIWLRYWIVKIFRNTLYQCKFLGFTEFSKLKTQLKKINKSRKSNLSINSWDSSCPSLTHVENLILLPKSLEFSNESGNRNKHLGYFESNLVDLIDDDIIPEDFQLYQKVILISQGSLQGTLNKDLSGFYLKFLELVKIFPNYYFIGSFDRVFLDSYNIESLDNLYVRPYLPQKSLLSKVDLFISHGGANSILESIMAECPLLITLNNHIFDQNGNAARIKFHGCGEFVDFNQPLENWVNKINQIFQNIDYYKMKIKQVKEKILNEEYELERLIFS